MRRKKLYIILGLIVMVVPFLGVPNFVRTSVLVVVGFIVVILSLIKRSGETNKTSVKMEAKESNDEVEG